jgi:hypothetical protein
MSVRKAWFSTIEYRPNAADPETGVIGLGFVIEFTTDKYWVVTAVMRAGIEDAQLADLDDLAKQVIQHRSDVIQKEIARVLPSAKEPGQALAFLSAANPWSLHVSEPRMIEATVDTPDASVERIEEEFMFSVYWASWLPAVQAREAGRVVRVPQQRAPAQEPGDGMARVPADVPQPWLLPPSKVIRPLVRGNPAAR